MSAPPSFLEQLSAVVERDPAAPALEDAGRCVSYGDLWALVWRMGDQLRRAGAGPEELVGLWVEKSPEYVVALLAAWAAGAAFVPLDPGLPLERLEFLVRDSGVRLAAVNTDRRTQAEVLGLRCLPISIAGSVHPRAASPDPKDALKRRERAVLPTPAPIPGSADALAYLIYTSGSTGTPKGVLVEHRGIVPLLEAQIAAFGLGPGKRSLFLLSTQFDASISDIGTALLSGATLCFERGSALETAAGLPAVLARRAITHLDLPPALLRVLRPEEVSSCLEALILGGEPCPPDIIRRWARDRRVVVVYGPTEATVCVSLTVCDAETWDRPLLGKPISTCRFCVLDSALAPTEPGGEGELFLSGKCLARGYHRRPELNAQRFITLDGERQYRTGDRVRLHPDGEYEFLGRTDRQIKRHGKLIAPEEIEAVLCTHPAVARAAVVVRERPVHGALLTACIQLRGESGVTPVELRRHVAARLPDWMVPQRFEVVSPFPLTVSGKPDLAALASQLEDTDPHCLPAAAEGLPHERALRTIWEQVLGRRDFGLDDDFFALGGDSLGVLEVLAAAEALGIRLSARVLLAHPSIRGVLSASADAAPPDAIAAEVLRREALARRPNECAPSRPLVTGTEAGVQPPEVILLTGATGFLGSRLAVELLQRSNARILCLVRADDAAGAHRRLRAALDRAAGLSPGMDSGRIEVLAGNVEQDRLGLPASTWDRLAREVDAIHHCAALVNMLLPFADLRAANLDALHPLLQLLQTGRAKRLHHASTLSVFVSTDRNQGVMREADCLQDTRWVYGGYAQTKWAAEHLLRAARDSGLPVSQYRFGLLTGDPHTGVGARGDFLALFFRGLAALGCVPESALDTQHVDITPISFAAAAMAVISLRHPDPAACGTYHIANEEHASVRALVEALSGCGKRVSVVSDAEWRRRLQHLQAGGSGSAAAACLGLCRSLDADAFQRHRTFDLFQATGTVFDMTCTHAALCGRGITCPRPTAELLRRYARCSV